MGDVFGRWIEREIAAASHRSKVRLILGARQTGKSTLLRTMAAPDAIVFNLQDRRERLRFERDRSGFVNILRAEPRRRMVLIDEIQKVPELLDDIQLLHDEDPGKFAFVVTGSSARKLRASASTLLPGRVHRFPLYPLVAVERKGNDSPAILPMKRRATNAGLFPTPDLEEMLLYGNLPGIARESPSSRRATLESYAEIYLEEEIRREAVVRNVGNFSRFLELAALEAGQTVNLSSLSQQSGVPVATLRTYYQILEDTLVGYRVGPFIGSPRKRLLTTPTFYFFDLGVRNALARIPWSRDVLQTQAGTLFQQWVATELWHRCGYLGRNYRISFWRTVSGAEVDLVLETPREVIPIEVKWTENPRPADARHLHLFLQTYPGRAKRGIVVCRVQRRMRLGDRVDAIPWGEL